MSAEATSPRVTLGAGREGGRERRIRRDPVAGPEGAAGAVGRQRGVRGDERAERRRAEAGRGADPDQAARAEGDELADDGGRARAAQAGALDRQRRPVGGRPAVAPEAAMVVEHPRPVDQLLGEAERAPGVAGQQHALGDGLVRLEDHGCMRHGQAYSS